jgi:hypothetical protein
MFLIGASFFSYQGPTLNPIVSIIGTGSLILCMPTIAVGMIWLIIIFRKL